MHFRAFAKIFEALNVATTLLIHQMVEILLEVRDKTYIQLLTSLFNLSSYAIGRIFRQEKKFF